MNALELDHFFVFCDPSLPEAKKAQEFGLKVEFATNHRGQGSANKCIAFQDDYFELIYLTSLKDARKNPLRLDLRANWKETGASPFGIALRGPLRSEDADKFWDYHPPYWQGTIKILKASEKLPLIFVMPQALRPIENPRWQRHQFEHDYNIRNVLRIECAGPQYEWPDLPAASKVTFKSAPNPLMTVDLDGDFKGTVPLSEIVGLA